MTFFGTHSTLSVPEARTPSLFSASASSVSQPSSRAPSEAGALSAVDGAEAIQATRENKVPGKEGVAGSVRSTNAGADEKSDKMARAVVEGLWKSVMEPAQEYTQVSPEGRVRGRHDVLLICRASPRTLPSPCWTRLLRLDLCPC